MILRLARAALVLVGPTLFGRGLESTGHVCVGGLFLLAQPQEIAKGRGGIRHGRMPDALVAARDGLAAAALEEALVPPAGAAVGIVGRRGHGAGAAGRGDLGMISDIVAGC